MPPRRAAGAGEHPPPKAGAGGLVRWGASGRKKGSARVIDPNISSHKTSPVVRGQPRPHPIQPQNCPQHPQGAAHLSMWRSWKRAFVCALVDDRGSQVPLPERRKLLALADASLEFAPEGWRSQATPMLAPCGHLPDFYCLPDAPFRSSQSSRPGTWSPRLAGGSRALPAPVESGLPTARTQSRGAGGHRPPRARAYLRGWC